MDDQAFEWVTLEVELPESDAEAAEGIWTGLGSTASELCPLPGGRVRLTGYFPPVSTPAGMAALAEGLLRALMPSAGFRVTGRGLGIVDWVARGRDYFHPTPVGEHFLIHPSWDVPADDGGRIRLEIDPQQAFGTGSHETTRLCISLMEKHFDCGFRRCCDAGCGSGILLIALEKWIRHRCGGEPKDYRLLGVDIDEASVETARENRDRNGSDSTVEFRQQDLAELEEAPFHFIFANLLSEIICWNRDLFGRMLAPGGRLLLSGILVEEEESVLGRFTCAGWRLLENARDGEWSALVLEKTGG